MTTVLEHTTELVVITCWCSMPHAVPRELRDHQIRKHNNGENVPSIYCPMGHGHVPSGKPKLLLEKERLQQRLANTEEDARIQAARAAKAETEANRIKKRSTAGVCPVPGCKRSVVQMARHIKTQHPDYHDHGA